MRSGILLLLIGLSAIGREPANYVREYWPNGNVRRAFEMRDGVRDGEYRTFTIDGKPYELKHFARGREDGLQQAWDDRGQLYLNYVVKNGRRYGMVNAKPCLPAAADGTSDLNAAKQELPFYSNANFTPSWSGSSHRVGEFSLFSQTGERFTDGDLRGRVHLASFIYTRCSGVCPALVASLRRVDRELRDDRFRIVSYSVTPDLDPPRVLAAFGSERGIDPSRWILATGEKTEIFRLARESYFASDEVMSKTLADPNAFLHTEKLILVDAAGKLRGVYDGTLPSDVDHAIADAKHLLGR